MALGRRSLIRPAWLGAATRDENRVARPSSALLGAAEPVDKTDAGAFPAPRTVAVSTSFSVACSVGPAGRIAEAGGGPGGAGGGTVRRPGCGQDEVVACVGAPGGESGRRQELRTFPIFTSGLETLADWLQAEGVTQVVMEATGQYWKPVWQVLEERGFQLLLVNARQVKILPGRRPTWPMPPGWRSCWSMGCCGAASCRRRPSGSCGISPATASGSSRPTAPRSSASRRPWRTPASN